MSWNTAYIIINALVLPAWALLVFAPRAKLTNKLVHSALWPLIMGGVYIGFLGAAILFGQSAPGTGFSNLQAVTSLFDHPNGVLTGWSHYLAFDLFVGAWIGRDAARKGLPHWQIVPCLIGAWIFGLVGLFAYFLLRAAKGHGFSLMGD